MASPGLYWLPNAPDWSDRLRAIPADDDAAWCALVQLANAPLDLIGTVRLDRVLTKRFPNPTQNIQGKPVRLAILASSTVAHLLPAIRVGALRRGLWLEVYLCQFGQYAQELLDQSSGLYRFKPTAVLFAIDSHHAATMGAGTAPEARADAALESLDGLWRIARERFGGAVIQQTFLPVYPSAFGSNEHRFADSPAGFVMRLNEKLRPAADRAGIDLLAVDSRVMADSLNAWYDPVLWHRAKQEVHPLSAPLWGDLVARLLAAYQGRSSKCLVLDLDNTLWGGVIGDDGLDGIVLGQGSALGEAFAAFQSYAKLLSRRGVILAVCSKNDEVNALEAFDKHPEMVLRRADISCFVANWNDKATNMREIAARLNIGLDSLVLADDNPFERNIVRQELPMVAVPELPEDPALFAGCLADAGYFETHRLTDEDLQRTSQYRANIERETLKTSAENMNEYLLGLDMELRWSRFTRVSLARLVQLINKTNQFNLRTKRYEDADVAALAENPNAIALQMRLSDRFGDNGIIGVVIGVEANDSLFLDTFLMSCRVLGRQVEEAILVIVAAAAKGRGLKTIVGEYRPSPKNGMVSDLYAKLGFEPLDVQSGGITRWVLNLAGFSPQQTFIRIVEE